LPLGIEEHNEFTNAITTTAAATIAMTTTTTKTTQFNQSMRQMVLPI